MPCKLQGEVLLMNTVTDTNIISLIDEVPSQPKLHDTLVNAMTLLDDSIDAVEQTLADWDYMREQERQELGEDEGDEHEFEEGSEVWNTMSLRTRLKASRALLGVYAELVLGYKGEIKELDGVVDTVSIDSATLRERERAFNAVCSIARTLERTAQCCSSIMTHANWTDGLYDLGYGAMGSVTALRQLLPILRPVVPQCVAVNESAGSHP